MLGSPLVAKQQCIQHMKHWIHDATQLFWDKSSHVSLDLELATTAVLVTCRSDTAPSQRVTVILYLTRFTATPLQLEQCAATIPTVLQGKVWFLKHCVWYMGMHTYTPTHKLSSQIDSLCVQGWYSRAHVSLLCTRAGCILGSSHS